MESSKRIKSTILDLPTDALLLIVSRLDHKDLQSLSLVSKPFLHLSNRFIRKLTFNTLPDDRSFTQIFTRFSSVNKITLRTEHVASALIAISKSQLNLEALKITNCPTYPEKHHMLSLPGKLKIKSLALDWFSKVKADQVVEFNGLFPLLEELYFGTTRKLDDAGIERLSLMVPNLRKIDLSRNLRLTDRALYALSTNCVNLEHIAIVGCQTFTRPAFCTFLRGCRNLRYLDLPLYSSKYPASNLLVAEAVSECKNIQHLSINLPMITNGTLGIFAKSRASLESLKMKSYFSRPNIDYTMTGLSAILCAFKCLTRLVICLPLPETDKFIDKKMSELAKSLPCLNGIAIRSFCPIYSTLFSLIENCPQVEFIYLHMMNVSDSDRRRPILPPVPRLIRNNYTVKYIRLHPSPDIMFEIALASFCPRLERYWDGDFPPEASFPNNPAVDWTLLADDVKLVI